ncbi:MAG: carboxypeptidase regulatory-like domain-containing protein [Pseudoxanthomonas sp.]
MTAPGLLAAILGLAALLGLLRILWWRAKAATPVPRWRIAVLLLAQPLCASLLYFTLLPPRAAALHGDETLAMLAADSDASSLAPARGATLVALPEAPAPMQAQAERQPDLATALRRHPQATRLRMIGSGLEARDREAARGLAVQFQPPAPARGLLRLHYPQRLAPGQSFELTGQVHAGKGDKVELLDPAGQRIALVAPDANGRFRIDTSVRSAGLAVFQLRLRDANGKTVERASVPLWIAEPEKLRALLLAGAPNAELKYLRRWAEDAGIALRTRIALGGGIALGDAAPLDAASLQKLDLLLLDGRALDALGSGERAVLRTAIERGLGLLLRIDGAPSAGTRAQLRTLGLAVEGDGAAATARLWSVAAQADAETMPTIAIRRLRVTSGDATPLLRNAEGHPLAWWRAAGRGRIGLLPIGDTYPLVLHGEAGRHGALWSQVFATLARPGSARMRKIDQAWVEQRIAICPAGEAARVFAPDGSDATLLADAGGNADAPACAAYWPQQPGWHWLDDGEHHQPFFVRANNDAPGLQRTARIEATQALTASTRSDEPLSSSATQPGPRGSAWPWFLAWLASAAALWWLERRRPSQSRTTR